MKKTLRPYQAECLESIENTFKETDRQLVTLPTGSGKTVIFLEYIKRYLPVTLIISPTLDLIEQTRESALSYFKPSDIYVHGDSRGQWPKNALVYICTSMSLKSAINSSIKFDLIIMDEAHRSRAPSYMSFLKSYKHKNYKVLGLTATPYRKDRKSLIDIFGVISYKKTLIDMINGKYLTDIIAHRVVTRQSLESKSFNNGDYGAIQLRKLDNESRNSLVIRTYLDHCREMKTVIFCLDIEHSESLANSLRNYGINASAIHGKMTNLLRKTILQDFKSGRIAVITNCQLLTEGFDEPSIEALIMARPTASLGLYTQMIGRGIRTHPNKKFCHIYEMTDNAHKLCNFPTLLGADPGNDLEYKNGIKLTELETCKEFISLMDVGKLELEEIDLLVDVICDPTQNQLYVLRDHGYRFGEVGLPNVWQAAFMIWEIKKLREYGIDRKNRLELACSYSFEGSKTGKCLI